MALGDVPKREHPLVRDRNNSTPEGGNAVARSTKRQSKKDADSPPDDSSKKLVEALMDDDEVVVDGFQRLSVLGLEMMTFDGPLRVRTLENPEEER